MGLIETVLNLLFGGGRNVVRDTAGAFLENAENKGAREFSLREAALDQFAGEFLLPKKSKFDQVMDGLNRVPRPALALGTLGLLVSSMVDPVWFAARMQGIALVPDPMWWLMGAIVSFYFGARHQVKSQDFQRSIATTMARTPTVMRNLGALDALAAGAGGARSDPNPALDDWKARDE
ncbi:MAG: holin family protein [Maritimibacter sp.]